MVIWLLISGSAVLTLGFVRPRFPHRVLLLVLKIWPSSPGLCVDINITGPGKARPGGVNIIDLLNKQGGLNAISNVRLLLVRKGKQ